MVFKPLMYVHPIATGCVNCKCDMRITSLFKVVHIAVTHPECFRPDAVPSFGGHPCAHQVKGSHEYANLNCATMSGSLTTITGNKICSPNS